jgi:16S rRNA (cytidine1402-2'-O)-methyltransferase
MLKEVDLVLCEDTRVTKNLLHHYNISTQTMSYHAQSKLAKVDKIFDLIEEGKDIALVSDAGTPCISDPGVMLISQIKEKFGEQVEIIPIPGASAVVAALSASGLPSSDFIFLGFLPHKKGRETLFKEIAASERTAVFYESPHRILKALESLKTHLEPEKTVVIGRELTKIFEQMITGTPADLLQYFEKNPDKVRGEFVVIVSPK